MRREVPDDEWVSRYINEVGELVAMPRKHSTRRIVLAHIAQSIEPDVDLDESSVNARLRSFSPDVATLRRYLVDAGLLIRRPPGVYRRSTPDSNPAE
jgi:hypothetical protein